MCKIFLQRLQILQMLPLIARIVSEIRFSDVVYGVGNALKIKR